MRFQQLLEYRDKHGDCKVPQHYKENKALGKWTAKQREQYKLHQKGKHSFLTPYRLEKLNQIGFVWQVRSGTEGVEDDPDEGKEGNDAAKAVEGGGGDGAASAAAGMMMKDPPPSAATAMGKSDHDDLVAEAAAMATAVAGEVEVKPEDVLVTANV